MIEKELCALTKQLMLTCMGGRNLDKIQEITGFFTNNAVVIGSRSDEFYTSVEQIENALNNDKWKEGRNYICRPVKEWFQCIPLSEKVFLVCGNIRLEMIFGSGDAGEAAQDYRAGRRLMSESAWYGSWKRNRFMPYISIFPCRRRISCHAGRKN